MAKVKCASCGLVAEGDPSDLPAGWIERQVRNGVVGFTAKVGVCPKCATESGPSEKELQA